MYLFSEQKAITTNGKNFSPHFNRCKFAMGNGRTCIIQKKIGSLENHTEFPPFEIFHSVLLGSLENHIVLAFSPF